MSAMPATAPARLPEFRAVPVAEPSVHVITAPDEAHERVARALRAARARTGLDEQKVVDKLAASGYEISLPSLRRAESTGALEMVLASALADLYGMTTDCLAGRRRNRTSMQAPSLRL